VVDGDGALGSWVGIFNLSQKLSAITVTVGDSIQITDISKQRTTLDGQSCLYKAKVTNAQEMAFMVKTKIFTIPVVHFMYHLSPSALGPAARRQKTSARATHYLAQRSTYIFTTITSSVQG
jgi:hypothetical protein